MTPPAPPSDAPLDLEASRIRARFESLIAAGLAINAELELAHVLQRVADSAREVVGARFAALGVLSNDGASLSEFVTSGMSADEHRRIGELPSGRGVLGLLITDARPIRISDISSHPRSHGFPPHHPPMGSFLGVPIVARKRVFGNLYLTEKIGAAEFSVEDEAIAVLLAAQTAVAVDNAQLIGRVQAMQQQRDQFFAMINHELRNALTGVYGWAEQLARAKSDASKNHAGREVFEAAERTIALMNNLLDLSRLDANKLQAMWHDVFLRDTIQRATSSVRPSAEAKGLTIAEDYPAPRLKCRTDPLRLEQIVINLLSNAIRHSPPQSTITVRIDQTPDAWLIHVIDHGPGIDPARQTQIFEPYVRVDPESGIGSGLGLPVARRLAELLGGTLTVQSVFGSGATFTLTLPLAPAPAT